MRIVARVGVLLLTLAVGRPVAAAPAEILAATIRLDPSVGPPTLPFRVLGRGFGPSEVVDITFDFSLVGSWTTSPGGRFSTRVAVPEDATPGDHTVTATGESSGLTASTTFIVRTDWPRFHFDVRNAGFNPFENVLNPSNVGSLIQKWSIRTSLGASPTPVVYGGKLYVAPSDGVVRALDPSSGSLIWSYDTGGAMSGEAADIEGGVLYVGNETGAVFALDASTGHLIWSVDLGDEVYFAVTVANGVVYLDEFQPATVTTVALDAATGATIWTKDTLASGAIAVDNGLLYEAADIGCTVLALNTNTGRVKWSYTTYEEVCGTGGMTAADGLVFLNLEYDLWAFNALTGHVVWRENVDGPSLYTAPAVANGVVYVGTFGQDTSDLFARDEFTGDLLWSADLPGGTEFSSPAVANGVLYIGADDGVLRAFDAVTGDLLWEGPDLDKPFRASPAVSDGVVYGATSNGKVYAFGLP